MCTVRAPRLVRWEITCFDVATKQFTINQLHCGIEHKVCVKSTHIVVGFVCACLNPVKAGWSKLLNCQTLICQPAWQTFLCISPSKFSTFCFVTFTDYKSRGTLIDSRHLARFRLFGEATPFDLLPLHSRDAIRLEPWNYNLIPFFTVSPCESSKLIKMVRPSVTTVSVQRISTHSKPPKRSEGKSFYQQLLTEVALLSPLKQRLKFAPSTDECEKAQTHWQFRDASDSFEWKRADEFQFKTDPSPPTGKSIPSGKNQAKRNKIHINYAWSWLGRDDGVCSWRNVFFYLRKVGKCCRVTGIIKLSINHSGTFQPFRSSRFDSLRCR